MISKWIVSPTYNGVYGLFHLLSNGVLLGVKLTPLILTFDPNFRPGTSKLSPTPFLEDHPMTCKWLGSPPIYKPCSWPLIWGPTTRSLGDLRPPWLLTTYPNWDDPPTLEKLHQLAAPRYLRQARKCPDEGCLKGEFARDVFWANFWLDFEGKLQIGIMLFMLIFPRVP